MNARRASVNMLLVNKRRRELKLIAHRGGRGFGKDNTLEAMESAARSGVRMIEADVRITADGELVVYHDAMVWGRMVSRLTAEELRRFSPESPLLREVLESLAGWVSFNIEVKDASINALQELLDAYSLEGDTLVTSFSAKFLDGFKSMFPGTRTGYIYRMPYGQDRRLENAMDLGAEVILPYYNSVSRELVADAHDYGLEVYAWTVNDESDFLKLLEWGVDGVITDRYFELQSVLAPQ